MLRGSVSEVDIEEEYRDARSGHSIGVLVRRRSAAGSTKCAMEVDKGADSFTQGWPHAEWEHTAATEAGAAGLQGYLAHKTPPPPRRTLQPWDLW